VDAAHARLVQDDWIDRFALAGTPDECLDKLRVFTKLGVNEIILLPITQSSVNLIQIFGRAILPRLR